MLRVNHWVIPDNPKNLTYTEYTENTHFWYLGLPQKSRFFTKKYSANRWLITLIEVAGSLQNKIYEKNYYKTNNRSWNYTLLLNRL